MREAELERNRRVNHPDAIALLVTDREDRVLVLWHWKHAFWTVPLGKVEDGEGCVAAARREAFEELGIEVEGVDLLDTIYKPHDYDDYSDIRIALCRVLSYTGDIANREPEKHARLQFLNASEILTLNPISFPTEALAKKLSMKF